ncbi:DMT family transporter [Nocardioides sp. SYSU D00065]|uniref:DMT family transporter n=1 Tax=Nocardioides sp. SYSU D00065 TaxID=2817378 RepID=UPI001B334DC9|nr:EamA family transporter [Nocardioides sp. SYSU D00065]
MGPLLVLLSAACFGAMAVFGKLAYDEGVSPQSLVLLRFVLAAALLVAMTALHALRTGRGPVTAPGSGRPHRLLLTGLALGGIGYALQATLYFAALGRIDAALVALVLYTYPVLVTLAAVLLGRERLTPARLAALGVSTLGTLLVLVGAGAVGFDATGVALAFGSALTYTVYILVSDATVRQVPPVVLTTLVMTGAAVVLSAQAALTGGIDLPATAHGWLWIACIAVVSTVVAALAFFAGMRRTGPSTASILSTFEPVATATLAALLLDEFLTPVQVIGGGLVLASVALVQLRGRGPRVEDDAGDQIVGRASRASRWDGTLNP